MDSMTDDTAGQRDRLCQNIRRTFKATVYVIVLTLLALWVTWSVIEVGVQHRLATVNSASVRSRLAFYAKYKLNMDYVTPANAWVFDDQEEAMDKTVLTICDGDPQCLKAFQNIKVRLDEIENYNRERKNAFNVEISLPYLREALTINALDLVNLWPFIVIIVLTVLFALRIRQRAYDLALASTFVKSERDISKQAMLHALTEFRVGRLTKKEAAGRTIWVYKKPFTTVPETVVILAFILYVAWYSYKLLFLSSMAMEATHSIFFNYYGYVFSAIVIAGVILKTTASQYRQSTSSILGAPVSSYLLYKLKQIFIYLFAKIRGLTLSSERIRAVIVLSLGIISMVSLAFPWMTPWSAEFRGFDFLRRYPPRSSIGIATNRAEHNFLLDPQIFGDIRLVLLPSILFVAFSIVLNLSWFRRNQFVGYFQRGYKLVAWSLLVLAGYILAYLLGLDYIQSNSQLAQSNALTGAILEGTHVRLVTGVSLLSYNPCPAFWFYFISCVILALLGAAANHKGIDRGRCKCKIQGVATSRPKNSERS